MMPRRRATRRPRGLTAPGFVLAGAVAASTGGCGTAATSPTDAGAVIAETSHAHRHVHGPGHDHGHVHPDLTTGTHSHAHSGH